MFRVIDCILARLKIEGWNPFFSSLIVGAVIAVLTYLNLIDLTLSGMLKYKISVLNVLGWALVFGLFSFSTYCSLLVKDFGVFVFTMPLAFFFGALSWVRNDLTTGTVTLRDSFQSVDFVASNFVERFFLTDMYYHTVYIIAALIVFLLAAHNADKIKGWFDR